MSKHCSFEEEQVFRDLTFKWSTAWDCKDESLFLEIAAPEILIDYRDFPAVNEVRNTKPEDFFKHAFQQTRLGDKRLKTQHLLGLGVFTRVHENEAKGNWQVRARHLRELPDGKVVEWDSSSFVEFRYVRIDGDWKLGGLRPHTIVAETGSHNDVVGLF